jgi:uncharacterized protein (DUF488 family)
MTRKGAEMTVDSVSEARAYQPLFTLGHSNLEPSAFLDLLRDHAVRLLVDVRSLPRSSRFPQFSQPGFEQILAEAGIQYLFLGEELGGRPDDPDAYRSDGVVDYRARRKSYAFQAGLERLLDELLHSSCALLCAEEDPLECHRFLMICPELVRLGIPPLHIRKGSRLETQEDAETRLLKAQGFAAVASHTLFPQAREDALEEAYELQATQFAYRVDPAAVDRW